MLTSTKSWQEIHTILHPDAPDAMMRKMYYYSNTIQGWNRMTRDEQKQYLVDNIDGCSDSIAEILVDASIAKFELASGLRAVTTGGRTVLSKTKSKIKSEETDNILLVAAERFGNKPFKNADIAPHIKDLSARQVPSRLKKLVESGHLQDLGGSPKAYQLVAANG